MSEADDERILRDASSDAIGFIRAVADQDTQRLMTILSLPSDREHNACFMVSMSQLIHEAYCTLPLTVTFDQWLDLKLEQANDKDAKQ